MTKISCEHKWIPIEVFKRRNDEIFTLENMVNKPKVWKEANVKILQIHVMCQKCLRTRNIPWDNPRGDVE